jgi:predicted Zn-dependent protease
MMGPRRRRARVLPLALGAIAGLGSACAPLPGTPREGERKVVLSTEYDDRRAGSDAAKEVEAEIGLFHDPALTAYVQGIGRRLLRYADQRTFDYRFAIVDQFEPNAFALPGGYIFVSRGLLALANSEDELANVIGHEITHAAARHAAAQQEYVRRQNPLALPWVLMANIAAYSRAQEADADRGGQMLAARAGYDPVAMADFLKNLGGVERLETGVSRIPSFAATHPGISERVADCAARGRTLEWKRDPSIETGRAAYLKHIEGITLGANPAEGVFEGDRFLHPDLDFHLQFPHGWEYRNTREAVGAIAPRGDAVIFLVAEGREQDPKLAAEDFVAANAEEFALAVLRSTPVRIGDSEAYRLEVEGSSAGQKLAGVMTFIPHGGLMYRISGVAPVRVAGQYQGRTWNTARSFRPLTASERASIRRTRLRVVVAEPDEELVALSRRTGNAWDPQRTAVLNGVAATTRFAGGETVKIAREEPYRPQPDAAPRP